MKILSEISIGELLDKISILEIKMEKIKDSAKREEVKKEYDILKKIQSDSIEITGELKKLFDSLKKVNSIMWDIEDKVRICEKNKDFGEKFIKLSRDVHFLNDDRAKIKLEMNNHTGSSIKEIKEYTSY